MTSTPVDSRIDALRIDITAIDEQILDLVARRVALSREVGALRMAAGGTRLSLAREQVIVDRFTAALGADGTALAMLLLRAGRGRL
ncbi:MAG: chorismate mutase [Geodermatophilaceae bacterium]|nr:chorismate mutase [Geodermatophilaceae bacterium]